jgi:dihydrodipicolinate synthase/N-acetylneuraminate lyase
MAPSTSPATSGCSSTGESPTLVGVGGNATRKVLATLKRLERHRFEGIVSVCPYYNRPRTHGGERPPRGAFAEWARLESLVPLLFREANPMPIKHCLWRRGRIASPECRLPLTLISRALADELDRALKDAVV